MIRYMYLFFLMNITGHVCQGQHYYTISGFVEDSVSGERLPGATLYEQQLKRGTACNEYGFFSITLPEGDYLLHTTYVGFHPRTFSFSLHRDTSLVIHLHTAGLLEEVIVEGHPSFTGNTRMGEHTLSLKQIKTLPALAGESDVLKILQALPGVNSGSEGTSGFSVRGGTPDQTQILLDGIPVYNVYHGFGYFSVFNGAALQNVSLLKGAIPARYGGRLSSILNISMREGNMRHFEAESSVSPLAGTVTAEGPIVKDKVSFLISGRICWANAFLQLVQAIANSEFKTGYNFYDLNGKINWKINAHNRFYLSFYNGRDGYYSKWNLHEAKPDKDGFNWGNISIAGRWNHLFNTRTFANTTLYYSRFNYNKYQDTYLPEEKRFDRLGSRSQLEDITLKTDLDYFAGERHHLRFGLSGSRQFLNPELSFQVTDGTDTTWRDATQGEQYLLGIYAEDEWELSEHWKLAPGIRFSGQWTTDGKFYSSVEPRLALTYKLGLNSSLKASFNLMQQSLHLLQNSSLSWKVDMWVPVTRNIKPGHSLLYSLGYYRQLGSELEFSAEGWYNDFQNTIRYEHGIRYLKQKNQSWEDYAQTGHSRAYGLDLMLNKPHGQINGWIAYSLSKAESSYTAIHRGQWFPSAYDRRHKLNIVGNYIFPEHSGERFRKVIAANFIYSSGNYTTVGHQIYALANSHGPLEHETNIYHPEYIKHPNNTRLPAYHHLDITLHLQNKKRKGESWSLGVYNIYFRKNPSFYYQKRKGGVTELRQISLLPIVPCITYNYRF